VCRRGRNPKLGNGLARKMIVQRSRIGMSTPGKEGSKRGEKSDLRPDNRLMDTTQTEREKPLNNIRRSRVRDRRKIPRSTV